MCQVADDIATSPIGLRVIDGIPDFPPLLTTALSMLAYQPLNIPDVNHPRRGHGPLFLDPRMSGALYLLASLSLALPPMPLPSSPSVWRLIRFGCVWLSLCGTVIYINHVIMAISYANLTSNNPSTVMQTNPQQDDHRRDTDPYIRPLQRCTTCHQVMGGLCVFEGLTSVDRHH